MVSKEGVGDEIRRALSYSLRFFLEKIGLIVLFSIPFIVSSILLVVSAAPTYAAMGAVFLRTGSMPELSLVDVLVAIITYLISIFIIADTIININLVTFSKRTLTNIKTEILEKGPIHAMRLFYIFTIVALVYLLAQIVMYEWEGRGIVYPLLVFGISYLLFFVPPALVMDNCDTLTAIKKSMGMIKQKPLHPIVWHAGLFLVLLFFEIFSMIFPYPFSVYFAVLINSLFVLPFFIIFQTQMYMEKYPLAK